MQQKKLLVISIIILILVSSFHFYALNDNLYWTYRWLDIPAHIVGGFWVSLTALYICIRVKHIDSITDYRKKALTAMIASVIVVAVIWEIYELIFHITSFSNNGYWMDSSSDVLNSVIGGLIAFVYLTKNKDNKKAMLDKKFGKDFAIVL